MPGRPSTRWGPRPWVLRRETSPRLAGHIGRFPRCCQGWKFPAWLSPNLTQAECALHIRRPEPRWPNHSLKGFSASRRNRRVPPALGAPDSGRNVARAGPYPLALPKTARQDKKHRPLDAARINWCKICPLFRQVFALWAWLTSEVNNDGFGFPTLPKPRPFPTRSRSCWFCPTGIGSPATGCTAAVEFNAFFALQTGLGPNFVGLDV